MFVKDVTYALRQMRRTPSFTLTAVLTLALGIGASATVFTVVDAVILQPLSFRRSEELTVIWERVKYLGSTMPYTGPNARHFATWQSRSSSFSGMTLFSTRTTGVGRVGEHPQLVGSLRAYPNFFDLLGVAPMMGRGFTSEDGVKGQEHVAVITYTLWESLFSGDVNVLGKYIRVGDVPCQVIGVLPRSFAFPKRDVLSSFPSKQAVAEAPAIEIVMPLVLDLSKMGQNSDYGNLVAIGLLKRGEKAREAEAELTHIEEQIVRDMPASERDNTPQALTAYVQPLQEAITGDVRIGLWLLMAAVMSLMLISCVNLANAQLGRAVTREREAAIRSALGASKMRLLWCSLTESLVIATVGGIAGVAMAQVSLGFFVRHAPPALPRVEDIHLNWVVVCFSVMLIAGSAILFGILPALHTLKTEPQAALQQNNGRSRGSRGGTSVRRWLIGFQVLACTSLLLVSGLFAKSLSVLLASDRGFNAGRLVAAEVSLSAERYGKDAQAALFEREVLTKLEALPSVLSAAFTSTMPLEGETWIDGLNPADQLPEHPFLVNMRWISPGYFETMQQKVVAGRAFDWRVSDAKAAMISENTARAAWPGRDAIGRRFKRQGKTFSVVGVVADSRSNSLKSMPANTVYLSFEDLPPTRPTFLVRTDGLPGTLLEEVRRAIWSRDSGVMITRVKTLDSEVNDSVGPERLRTDVLIGFAVAALLLAMLGIYGVLSYSVAGRKQEIGVRMALGATRQSIYILTMSEVAWPLGAGLVSGWAVSLVIGRIVQALLYGVVPTDIPVGVGVFLLFVMAAAMAAFLPAHRAASVDPMQALRTD